MLLRLFGACVVFPFAFLLVTGLAPSWFVFEALTRPSLSSILQHLAMIFVGTALFDIALGQWSIRPTGALERTAGRSLLTRLLPWVCAATVPIGVLSASSYLANNSEIGHLEFIGCAAFVGVLSGAVGLVSAHELIHRRGAVDRAIGALTLCFLCYPCFLREHVYGHHRNVATRQDPSTARYGESLYRFLPRAVAGNVRNAWAVETEILRSRGHRKFSARNKTLALWLISAAVVLALGIFSSVWSSVFFVTQAAFAILILESINYVQHYGLARAIDGDGEPEPVASKHSWNAPFWFSNVGFLNLLIHSDHHLYERRPFPLLRLDENVPTLPLPAFTMLLLAMVPPIWFALMNDRAQAVNAS